MIADANKFKTYIIPAFISVMVIFIILFVYNHIFLKPNHFLSFLELLISFLFFIGLFNLAFFILGKFNKKIGIKITVLVALAVLTEIIDEYYRSNEFGPKYSLGVLLTAILLNLIFSNKFQEKLKSKDDYNT